MLFANNRWKHLLQKLAIKTIKKWPEKKLERVILRYKFNKNRRFKKCQNGNIRVMYWLKWGLSYFDRMFHENDKTTTKLKLSL